MSASVEIPRALWEVSERARDKSKAVRAAERSPTPENKAKALAAIKDMRDASRRLRELEEKYRK